MKKGHPQARACFIIGPFNRNSEAFFCSHVGVQTPTKGKGVNPIFLYQAGLDQGLDSVSDRAPAQTY